MGLAEKAPSRAPEAAIKAGSEQLAREAAGKTAGAPGTRESRVQEAMDRAKAEVEAQEAATEAPRAPETAPTATAGVETPVAPQGAVEGKAAVGEAPKPKSMWDDLIADAVESVDGGVRRPPVEPIPGAVRGEPGKPVAIAAGGDASTGRHDIRYAAGDVEFTVQLDIKGDSAKVNVDGLTPNQVGTGGMKAVLRDLHERFPGVELSGLRVSGANAGRVAGLGGKPPAPTGEAPVAEAPRPDTTSVKKAVVTEERAARDLEPVETSPTQSREGWVTEARAELDRNPNKARELVDELTTRSRPHTPVEAAILDIHKVNLRNSYKEADRAGVEAAAKGDRAGVEEAKRIADRAEADMQLIDEATTRSGEEWGRAGIARQIEMAQDYSLVTIRMRRRRANGYEELNKAQMEETRSLHAQLEKAIAERDAARVEAVKAKAGGLGRASKSRGGVNPKSSGYGAKNRIVTREAYEITKAELQAQLSRLSANPFLDPAILKNMIKAGTFHLEAGARQFAEWARVMTDEYGEKIKPHLKDAFDRVTKEVTERDIANVSDGIRAGITDGKSVAEMVVPVGKLAELLHRSGIRDREALITEVHETLKLVDPTITRRQAMDAISGYGRVTPLDTDPTKVEMRELKGQMQQLAKLDDMKAGKAPLKSGPERQPPGDEQRKLVRQVNEAKREGGYDASDPATQLRSTLDATKTRLRNEISDLTRQIDAKVKDVPDRTKSPTDAEVDALKAKREELKGEFDRIFGKSGLTDAQRVEAAIKATERSIAEYERKVSTGDVFPKKAEPKTPSDPRLTALKARQAELRQLAQDMRAAATPRRGDYATKQAAMETRLRNRLAKLTEIEASGDFGALKRKSTPIIPTREALRLEAQVQTAMKAIKDAEFRDHLARRSLLTKAAMVPVEAAGVAMGAMTSGEFSGLGRQGWLELVMHPITASRAIPDMFRAFGNPLKSIMAGGHALAASKQRNPLKAIGEAIFASGERGRKAQAIAEAYIKNHPDYADARKTGIDFTDHGDVSMSRMEEGFPTRFGQNLPVIASSSRAMSVLLNRIRMDVFSQLKRSLPPGEATVKQMQVLAGAVNTFTSRASLGEKGNALGALAAPFFSARHAISRFQIALGYPMWRGLLSGKLNMSETKAARKIVMKEFLRLYAGLITIYGVTRLFGQDDETDARSSDFAKAERGSTRVDMFAGLQQAVVFMLREITGMKKDAKGKLYPIRGKVPYGKDDAWDVIANYIRSKLGPVSGSAVDLATGKDYKGDPTDLEKEITEMLTPMTYRDIYKMSQDKDKDIPEKVVLGLMAMFGFGVNTHDRGR
jgi:hypothetical protein